MTIPPEKKLKIDKRITMLIWKSRVCRLIETRKGKRRREKKLGNKETKKMKTKNVTKS